MWRRLGTCVVCAYLLCFRVWDIQNGFPLLGEQVRDWSIAQRAFVDLPLIGPRSVNSGLDIGPIYYWTLWAARVTTAPFLGPLPHAGGWAIAILETIADGVLLVALAKRLRSWWLAAAIVIFQATGAPGAALSSVIWNPPIAEAFAKLTTASVLWPGAVTVSRSVLTIGLAVLAVQAHASAILMAIPLTAFSLWSVARERGMRAVAIAASAGVVILALWAAVYIGAPVQPTSPSSSMGATGSVVNVLAAPLSRLRPLQSADAVADALEFLLLTPFTGAWLRWLMLAGALTMIVAVRDPTLMATSAAPLVMAVAVFSLWQGQFGEAYWFLVILAAATLCLVAPIMAIEGRARQIGVTALIAVVAIIQPARAHHTWTAYRQPAYGPLARGVTAAAASGIAVRAIKTDLQLPPGMDPYFMFSLVGGRLDDTAIQSLTIAADGTIRYTPAE